MTTEHIFRREEQSRLEDAKRILEEAKSAGLVAFIRRRLLEIEANLELLDNLRCDFAVVRDDEVIYPRRSHEDDAKLAEIQAANKRADDLISARSQAALASLRAEA